jgi:hypothetical protein
MKITQTFYCRGNDSGPYVDAHYYSDWETAKEAADENGECVYEVTGTLDPDTAKLLDDVQEVEAYCNHDPAAVVNGRCECGAVIN